MPLNQLKWHWWKTTIHWDFSIFYFIIMKKNVTWPDLGILIKFGTSISGTWKFAFRHLGGSHGVEQSKQALTCVFLFFRYKVMKLVNWTWAFTNAVMLVHNPADWLWKRKWMEKEGTYNIDWLVYELRDDNTMVSLFHRSRTYSGGIADVIWWL